MFKSIVKTGLGVGLVLGLVACGGGSDENPPEKYKVFSNPVTGGHFEVSDPLVFKGYSTSARIVPDAHYKLVSAIGCGGTIFNDTWYITGSILANCEITPTFALETFVVSVATVPGGSVTPASQEVSYGGFAKLTIAADEGYQLKSISGCGGTLTAKSYTTGKITAACNIVPIFEVAPVAAGAPVISGLAAEGAALENATITAKCADGSGFLSSVVTDAQGNFSGTVGANALPCALSVTDAKTGAEYFSLAIKEGRTNITPLTSLVIALASQKTGKDWLAQSDWQSTISQLPVAQTFLGLALSNAGYNLPDEAFLPLTTEFKVGDDWDKVLDEIQLEVKSNPNIGNFNALINLIKDGNLGSLAKLH